MTDKFDYLSFQLHGLAAGVSKLLGNKEAGGTEIMMEELFQTAFPKIKEEMNRMISEGQINEAEEALYQMMEDETLENEEVFSLAEWFFDRLMHLSDELLEKGNCSVSDIAMKKIAFFSGRG